MQSNPELDQDRVFDLFDTYKRHGVVMFHQQRAIYEFVASQLSESYRPGVLEAGCGNGIGSAILSIEDLAITATDKLQSNIDFARQLYPWIKFDVWDLNQPWHGRQESTVVCIEAFEHVGNPQLAMKHLMEASTKDVWLSTPNGMGRPRPPENPHHCCEYTPEEMVEFIRNENRDASVMIFECDKFTPIVFHEITPDHSPLLYHIEVA